MAEAAFKALTVCGRDAPRKLSDLRFHVDGDDEIASFRGIRARVRSASVGTYVVAVAYAFADGGQAEERTASSSTASASWPSGQE